ncbi:MAG TPA: sugar phosphate isomerase/epimerase [Nostocaceae cyanobacterium]|nr:sugar phosphate isomerase/epimerase [Nostocaceae cyanobacterium]
MSLHLNLCTAVLSKFTFEDVIEIAIAAGYQGIELRVKEDNHKSLDELTNTGVFLQKQIQRAGLAVPVLNSYISIEDTHAVDQIIECCQKMNVPKVRLVLPKSCNASVANQGKDKAIIPSFESHYLPSELLNNVKKILRQLELKAYKAGVKILLELHWGTIMSSFSSAYSLTHDLDPNCIAITFDPANMMVEGKEDWEFGLKLIRSHIGNVHVKNMSWFYGEKGWSWEWSALTAGMVNWAELICLLNSLQYSGDYAIEDFLVPKYNKQSAMAYLSWVNDEFSEIYEHISSLNLGAVMAS